MTAMLKIMMTFLMTMFQEGMADSLERLVNWTVISIFVAISVSIIIGSAEKTS
jgi:hypothetical protein